MIFCATFAATCTLVVVCNSLTAVCFLLQVSLYLLIRHYVTVRRSRRSVGTYALTESRTYVFGKTQPLLMDLLGMLPAIKNLEAKLVIDCVEAMVAFIHWFTMMSSTDSHMKKRVIRSLMWPQVMVNAPVLLVNIESKTGLITNAKSVSSGVSQSSMNNSASITISDLPAAPQDIMDMPIPPLTDVPLSPQVSKFDQDSMHEKESMDEQECMREEREEDDESIPKPPAFRMAKAIPVNSSPLSLSNHRKDSATMDSRFMNVTSFMSSSQQDQESKHAQETMHELKLMLVKEMMSECESVSEQDGKLDRKCLPGPPALPVADIIVSTHTSMHRKDSAETDSSYDTVSPRQRVRLSPSETEVVECNRSKSPGLSEAPRCSAAESFDSKFSNRTEEDDINEIALLRFLRAADELNLNSGISGYVSNASDQYVRHFNLAQRLGLSHANSLEEFSRSESCAKLILSEDLLRSDDSGLEEEEKTADVPYKNRGMSEVEEKAFQDWRRMKKQQ